MDISQDYNLTSLLVFQNTLNKELVRSLHVYKLNDGNEKEIEREFLFSLNNSYVEMAAIPLLSMARFRALQIIQGQVMGLWLCIFAFHSHHSPNFNHIPSILSRNPKLKSIPILENDLRLILKLSSRTGENSLENCSDEIRKREKDDCNRSRRNLPVLDQDLNCLPYSVSSSEQPKDQQIVSIDRGGPGKKKRRAAAEDIASIALEDLSKYFNQPIIEASRSLKIGLTVLKKKCREFGIPRWPHRKIKSLDSLIRSLQDEAERQKQENEDAATAAAQRQKMLEMEKETIERKPFTEIQSETKRLRQDVFKKRHRARVLQKAYESLLT